MALMFAWETSLLYMGKHCSFVSQIYEKAFFVFYLVEEI